MFVYLNALCIFASLFAMNIPLSSDGSYFEGVSSHPL